MSGLGGRDRSRTWAVTQPTALGSQTQCAVPLTSYSVPFPVSDSPRSLRALKGSVTDQTAGGVGQPAYRGLTIGPMA